MEKGLELGCSMAALLFLPGLGDGDGDGFKNQ